MKTLYKSKGINIYATDDKGLFVKMFFKQAGEFNVNVKPDNLFNKNTNWEKNWNDWYTYAEMFLATIKDTLERMEIEL